MKILFEQLTILICGALLSVALSGVATAAPGNLDPTYGTNGVAIHNIGRAEGLDGLFALARQGEGKLVGAGFCGTPTGDAACVIRLNADGTTDTSFGTQGAVVREDAYAVSTYRGVIVDGDRIVAAGYCKVQTDWQMCIEAFDGSGQLDTTFGGTGSVVLQLSPNVDLAYALLRDSAGRYVIGGSCRGSANADFCIVRLASNGTPDTSFGIGGTAVTPIGTGVDTIYAMAFDGAKIVAAGSCENATGSTSLCVARFLPDGTLDITFNGVGFRTISFGTISAIAYGVVAQSGNVYVTGRTIAINSDVLLAAMLENGALDVGFNGTGILQLGLGTGYSIAMQGNQLITVGDLSFTRRTIDLSGMVLATNGGHPFEQRGTAYAMLTDASGTTLAGQCPIDETGYRLHICVRRYDPNGSLDTSFGDKGTAIRKLGTYATPDKANATKLQPDGKLVVVGDCFGGACVARFLPNGQIDTTFGNRGVAAPIAMAGRAVAVSGSHIFVAGMCGYSICIARLTSDGHLDSTFMQSGLLSLAGCSQLFFRGEIMSIATASGKLFVAGGCEISIYGVWGVYVRLLLDGNLDPSFNAGQALFSPIGPPGGFTNGTGNLIRSAATVDNGAITAVGVSRSGEKFSIARFLSDGAPDFSFGGTGEVTIDMSPSGAAAQAVTLAAGKIVVAGKCNNGTNEDFCVVRLHPDGSLDTSFNSSGKKLFPVGDGDDIATQVMMLGQKIVMSGFCKSGGFTRYCMAVLMPDGSFDTTFGGGGTSIIEVGYNAQDMYAMDIANGYALLAGTCVTRIPSANPIPQVSDFEFCVAKVELPSPNVPVTSPSAPGISRIDASNGALTVQINPPATDGGSPISNYTVSCTPSAIVVNSAQTSVLIGGVANGTTYTCTATATNTMGTSASSAPVSAMPMSMEFLSAVSRKSHGIAGVFDLQIARLQDLQSMTVEPRNSNGSHQVILQFNEVVTQVGAVTYKGATGTDAATVMTEFTGQEVAVNLSNVLEGTRGMLRVHGVNGMLNVSFPVGFHSGNINGVGVNNRHVAVSAFVSAADIALFKSRYATAQPVNALNFLFDTNLDGNIDSRDSTQIRGKSGQRLNLQ